MADGAQLLIHYSIIQERIFSAGFPAWWHSSFLLGVQPGFCNFCVAVCVVFEHVLPQGVLGAVLERALIENVVFLHLLQALDVVHFSAGENISWNIYSGRIAGAVAAGEF